MSFQELNDRTLQEDFQPFLSNYDSISFTNRRKGIAIFYNKEKFDLLNSKRFSINQKWRAFKSKYKYKNLEKNPHFTHIDQMVTTRDDAGIICHLSYREHPDRQLIFLTTHLFHHPDYPDVKLIQTVLLVSQLEDFRKKYQIDPSVPIILTGDLNSLPLKMKSDEYDYIHSPEGLISGVYEYLNEGKLDTSHPHHPNQYNQFRQKHFTAPDDFRFLRSFFHSLALKSAYKIFFGNEPVFTNKTDKFEGTLDYIWVSKSVQITNMNQLPENSPPIPNAIHPSDHFPLVCDLDLPSVSSTKDLE